MRNELRNIERIEDYLLGKPTSEEKDAIEQEINSNPDFKTQVEQQKLIIQAVKRKAIKAKIKKLSGGGGNMFLKGGILLTIITVVILLGYTVINSKSIFKGEETIVNELNIGGLQTWVEPDIQKFTFKAEEGSTIEGKDGILIIVPHDAFIYENSELVKGEVNFELVEALTMDDMVLYNLTTVSDGKVLETGGMFYTNATQNGKQLAINPERPLYIEIPTNTKKEGMMVWKGEATAEGNINWKNPKPLQKFLVKIDFENLDFLPSGFEERVREEPKNSPFYLETKAQIDSLYYTLTPNILYKQVNVLDTKLTNQFRVDMYKDSLIKYTDRSSEKVFYTDTIRAANGGYRDEALTKVTMKNCKGINPLSVKTIRANTFSNTYLATKAFEERLSVLHSLNNGEELLQLYINNLAKNLWEVDAMITDKLSGEHKTKFEVFKNQRLTNLKDAEIYQDKLSAFYNTKKAQETKALNALRKQLNTIDKKEITRLQTELRKLKNKASRNFDKTVQKQINKSEIKKLPTPSVASSQVYATPWFSFGWANIDRYMKYLDNGSQEVAITTQIKSNDVKIYQWLNIIKTLTPITLNQGQGTSKFPKYGSTGYKDMKNTQAIALAKQNKNFLFGIKTYNPYQTEKVNIEMQNITLDALKAQLSTLYIGTEPLVKRLEGYQVALEQASVNKENKSYRLTELEKFNKAKRDFVNKETSAKKRELGLKQGEVMLKDDFERQLMNLCFECDFDYDINPEKTTASEDIPIDIAF